MPTPSRNTADLFAVSWNWRKHKLPTKTKNSRLLSVRKLQKVGGCLCLCFQEQGVTLNAYLPGNLRETSAMLVSFYFATSELYGSVLIIYKMNEDKSFLIRFLHMII